MSRNEHGQYGARYEAHAPGPVAGGDAQQPPHTGVEHPLAPAPHVGRDKSRGRRTTPNAPAALALAAVLLGALSMVWPAWRLEVTGSDAATVSVWLHGATSIDDGSSVVHDVRPLGLALYILLLAAACGGALAGWLGRSLRSHAMGLLATAVFAGGMLVASFPVLSANIGSMGNAQDLGHPPGAWLGLAAGALALIAALLFFSRLGRTRRPRVHD